MVQALIAVGIFIGGFLLGWLAHTVVKTKRDPTKSVLGVLIVLMWATSVIADISSSEYATPWEVHALVGGVVGWLFGVNPLKRLGNGKDAKG